MDWREAFTVVDFEMSGVDSDTDRVLEVGVVRFDRGQITARCNYVVYADVEITPEVTQITGLRPGDIAGGWPFYRVWEEVAPLFKDAVPVAYNAPFDRRFLQAEFWRHHADWDGRVDDARHLLLKDTVWLDPLVFIWEIDKYKKGKKLVDACRRRGIPLDRAHQAVYDAQATGELLLTLGRESKLFEGEVEKTQLRLAVERAHSYAAYKAGGAVKGRVFVCDGCGARAFGVQRNVPEGWAYYRNFATCSIGCDAHLLKLREFGGIDDSVAEQ